MTATTGCSECTGVYAAECAQYSKCNLIEKVDKSKRSLCACACEVHSTRRNWSFDRRLPPILQAIHFNIEQRLCSSSHLANKECLFVVTTLKKYIFELIHISILFELFWHIFKMSISNWDSKCTTNNGYEACTPKRLTASRNRATRRAASNARLVIT